MKKVMNILGSNKSGERTTPRRDTKHVRGDRQRGRVWGETTRGQDLKDTKDLKPTAKPAPDAALIKKAIEKTNVGARMNPEHMGDLVDHMEVRRRFWLVGGTRRACHLLTPPGRRAACTRLCADPRDWQGPVAAPGAGAHRGDAGFGAAHL